MIFWLYDESNGLPSKAISTLGLFVDHLQRVWVGNATGHVYSNKPLINDQKALTPQVVGAQVNGIERKFMQGLSIPFGSFLDLSISCITFPSNKINLQYRIPERDTVWRNFPGSHLVISDLPAGGYTIEVRAKKIRGYDWSDVRKLILSVEKPVWQQPWFVVSGAFLVGLIAWRSHALASHFSRKRRLQFERLVNLRTPELKSINDELSMRNNELDRFVYSASHDLSAPLKSIRGLISIAKLDKPEPGQRLYLDKILEMFFRATDAVQGSGLGLYILLETVHRLGGDVVVDSELGKGTTFSVSLPK